jgi:outer membrane protein TolC
MNPRDFSPVQAHRIALGWLIAACFVLSGDRGRADDVQRVTPTLSFAEVDEVDQSPALSQSAIFAADEQLVDFFAALQLAESQNPNIGLARQAIQDALAQKLQACSMLLPTLRAGANYRNHQGDLQSSPGAIVYRYSSSLYVGSGVGAVGSGTVTMPGVQIAAHVGDSIFEPLAARQLVASRNLQAEATANQVLLDVSKRFLDLSRAEAELLAFRQSEKDMEQVVQITNAFAKAKEGRQADALRAQTAALALHSQAANAEEKFMTASAELARVLSLDPAVRLRANSQESSTLEIVDAQRDLEELLQLAQKSRPELAALSAEVARKQIQVRQERTRPLFPTISVGFSGGAFGGGTMPQFGQMAGRTDFDVVAYWTLKNMGFGNRALQKERMSEQRQAELERVIMVNEINFEVADAQALVLSRRQDLDIAHERLVTAEKAFREDVRRIQGNFGLPIELLNSLDRLVRARVGIIRVIQEYNLAQMQLFVALGQSPLAASPVTQRRP